MIRRPVSSVKAAEAGFALVEALVALGAIGVVSGLFMAAVQSSALAEGHLREVRRATLVAQSRLAQALVLGEPDSAGSDGPFLWSTTARPYSGTPNGPGLERVTVTVRDRASGRTVASLETLRLAR